MPASREGALRFSYACEHGKDHHVIGGGFAFLLFSVLLFSVLRLVP